MLDSKKHEKYMNVLKNIKFKSIENFDVSKILSYPILYYTNNYYIIKIILNYIIKKRFVFSSLNSNENNYFVATSEYSNRNDHIENMNMMSQHVTNSCTLVVYNKWSFSLKRLLMFMKKVTLITIWNKQLKNKGIPSRLKRYIIVKLLVVVLEGDEIFNRIDNLANIKTVTTYCDVHSVDSYLIQKINRKKDLLTATLQHGHFDINTTIGKYAYINSCSDYFLASNFSTLEDSKKVGYNILKMKVCGPVYLDSLKDIKENLVKCKVQKIGILMAFVDYYEENTKLINILNKYSKNNNYKFIFRFHPSTKVKDYKKEFVNFKNYEIPQNQSLKDFVNNVDLLIMGSTSLYEASFFINKPLLKYTSNGNKKLKLLSFVEFSTYEDFIDVFEKMIRNNEEYIGNFNKAKDYYTIKGDMYEKYNDFYTNL